jgi:hypothetical protein
MEIVGYILIGIGVLSLFGNLTGAGGADDPSASSVNNRAGCWVVVIVIGGLAVWLAS